MRSRLSILLRDIALLGLPLAAIHCEDSDGCGCTDKEVRFDVARDDPKYSQALVACEASASDCNFLCTLATRTYADVSWETVSVVSCRLEPLDGGDIEAGSADAGSAERTVVATYRGCYYACASGRLPAAARLDLDEPRRRARRTDRDRQPRSAVHGPMQARPATPSATASRAGWFRIMARLEAASVVAFEELARDLASCGAPRKLVAAVLRARADEVRHTELAASLAGEDSPVLNEFEKTHGRSLEQLAILNASEGCVHETFGALVATYQALHARDPRVRDALSEIAADETRHAELAWALRRWFDARLDASARARVANAERAAWADVVCAHGPTLSGEDAAEIGLPPCAAWPRFVRELRKLSDLCQSIHPRKPANAPG